MSLEKVDLLSVLRRAKSASAASAVAEAGKNAEGGRDPYPAVPEEPAPVAAESGPKLDELEEIADLRAELFNDEMLMQRILGLLYRRKKANPNGGFISILEMERILHVEREGASFIMAYMKTQKVMEMDDKSRLAITVPGINYLRTVLGLHAASIAAAPEEIGK